MRCDHCGSNIVDGATRCSTCGNQVSQVSVLSPHERESFDGVTIEQDGGERSERHDYSHQQRVYFHQINLGGNNKLSGLVTLLLIGLLIVIFLFFAVPLVMLVLVGAVVMWIINRLFF